MSRIAGFKGRLIEPDHQEYDQARRVWNGVIDRHPALIAQCLDSSDVRAALAHARYRRLQVAVRGGGHSLAGHGVCDGVVIDLRNMNAVVVDPLARIAVVGPGARWGEVDVATRPHGLGTPGGDTSTVGVAGLTLGGGLGWLSRMYGMTCDNLVSADIVTADQELLHVDDASHPELMWALRGGGGNFGVVTSLRLRLHPVPAMLLAGVLSYPATAAPAVLSRLEEMTPGLPDEVSWAAAFCTTPAVADVPAAMRGRPIMALRLCYVGPPDEKAAAALAPIRALGEPITDTVAPMSYTALQQLTDANAPPGVHYASGSEWLRHLGERTIESFVEAARAATSAMSLSLINPLGGAVARRPADATAFAYRHAAFAATIVAGWAGAADDQAVHRAWARQLHRRLLPASAGGGYVNILGDEGPERVRTAYGVRPYARLVAVKDRYDPSNVFSSCQNIPPSGCHN
jgi:FAD/FMN-containing dehydrogenase